MKKNILNYLALWVIVLVISNYPQVLNAQTFHFASFESSDGEVTNDTYAADDLLATFAKLEAKAGFLGSAYTGSVDVQFASTLTTGTPVYFALSQTGSSSFLKSLLGGTLGGVVTDLVEGLVVGTPTITIRFKNVSGGTISTHNFEAGTSANVEIGEDGLLYLRINAPANTRKASITLSNPALLSLSGSEIELNVHEVFYFSGSAPVCNPWMTTKYDISGISLTLLSNNPEPVINAHHAIDDSPSTFSKLGYSTFVGTYVGSTIFQDIYFNSLSSANEEVVISFERLGALLNVDLLNKIHIQVSNGTTVRYSGYAHSLLTVDALNILSLKLGGAIPDRISIPVTGTFDRVRISYTQGVDIELLNAPLKLFDVYKSPIKPTLSAYTFNVCGDLVQNIPVTNTVTGVTYKWMDQDLNEIYEGNALNYTAPAHGVSDTLFVYAENACGRQSALQPFVVIGNDVYCETSDISGSVDVSLYETTNPLNAILTDISYEVQLVDPVSFTDGSYGFDDVSKGNYLVMVVNYDVAVGDNVTNSDVDAGYSISASSIPMHIMGDGAPVSDVNFYIDFGPLSLNWKDHTIQQWNNQVKLEWSVIDNAMISHFEILKSVDGVQFEKISNIHPQTQNIAYQFMDADVTSGYYYFQILMHLKNGSKYSSKVLFINVLANQNNYKVYPTVFDKTIQIESLLGTEQIFVYDIIGNLMIEEKATANSKILNMDGLASGTYFVRIMNTQQGVRSFKVVKK